MNNQGNAAVSLASIIGVLLWACLAGYIAQKRGKSFILYFGLSFLCSPLIAMIAAAIKSKNQNEYYSVEQRSDEDITEKKN